MTSPPTTMQPPDAYRNKFDRLMAMLGSALESAVRGDGEVDVEVPTRRQRTQVVHLVYQPRRDDEPPRLIARSPIGAVPRRLDCEDLLRRNAALPAGAICIDDLSAGDGEPQPYLLLRATHLLPTADDDEVWRLVHAVAHAADELEYDLFAHDDH